ncbi:MAG TPA: glycosyltransferase [Solirubrobacteraceae bacterium]|nr:glycosyltransferase [Solirubrobacteraceae bacterium]
MRICLVYDCLYPYTVGGAERWYRNLGERLAAEGHDVTMLTLRQWDRGERADVEGVEVVAVGPRMRLYVEGRRRILPPLVFGAGVLWHLLRRGRRYDVVHTASFPYFSLLAAAAVRPVHGFQLVVDWFELWTRDYWREYLGRGGGAIGSWVQRLCVRVPQRAYCFSRLHARRLREEGLRGDPTALTGIYAGELDPPPPRPAEPVVVFAGRHIPEKRVPAIVPAIAVARAAMPELRAEIYGDGPDHEEVERLVAEGGLDGAVAVPGFVDSDVIDGALSRALCLLLPSRREGYGLVVVEAAARGTPSVVVEDPDNAATELVEDGVNGAIAPSSAPEDLAAAVLRVHAGGDDLRRSTWEWFRRNGPRLSLDGSLSTVAAAYDEGARRARS